MEANREGTDWGKWSTSQVAQVPGGYGPRFLSEPSDALTSHPQPPPGAWESFEGVLGWERAGPSVLRPEKPISGECCESSFSMKQRDYINLFFTSSGILTILSYHLNFFCLELFGLTKLH